MRLEPSLPFMPGETPASYVSRLARINGLPTGRDLCRDLGIRYRGLVEGEAAAVARICELTGSPVEQVLREARIPEVSRSLYRLRGQSVIVPSFVAAGIRICPACVAEDIRSAPGSVPGHVAPYGRTTWSVAHLRTCPIHDLAMIDLPGAPLTTQQDFASVVGPWVTGGGAAAAQAQERRASGFERYLLDRLEGRPTCNWFDQLPFYAAARTCEMLGSVLAFGPTRKPKLLGPDDWARSGREGFQVIAEGPVAIADALTGLVASYGGNRATPAGPQAWFGTVYQWLEYQTPDPAYDPLRDLLVRCVADNAPFNPNERMFGKLIPYRKVHSIRSAANEANCECPRLRKALDKAGYLKPGHDLLPDHEVTFDATEAAGFLRMIASAMTLLKAASHLGIDWRQAKQLVDAGHLPTLAPGVTGTSVPCVAREDLEALVNSLRARAETVPSMPDGACSLPLAVRRAQSRLVDIVGLIRGGGPRWIGCLDGASGLESVLVDVAEVRSRVRRRDLAGLTRREVEQSLGIPTETARILISKGVLAATVQRHPTVPRDVVVVAQEEVERFRARYARVSDLATKLGLSVQALPRALRARGIEPALTKREFHATFYERAGIPDTLHEE